MTIVVDAKSTTKSGVAAGTIEVTDKDKQKQDVDKLNRDTKNTLNKLEQIFDKKTVQERQELAKVFGEVAYKYIGDQSVKNKLSKDQQLAAHTIIGGIMANLDGGDFLSGAAGAGVGKMLADEISKIKDPALRQWVSAAIGAAIGKVTGDAQSGSSTAASGRHNNDEAHIIKPETIITLLIAGKAITGQEMIKNGVKVLVDAAGNIIATATDAGWDLVQNMLPGTDTSADHGNTSPPGIVADEHPGTYLPNDGTVEEKPDLSDLPVGEDINIDIPPFWMDDAFNQPNVYTIYQPNSKENPTSFPLNDSGYYGEVGQSENNKVRNITGGIAAAQQFYNEITDGYTKETIIEDGSGGYYRTMPNGIVITFRPISSSDGTPAIDINTKSQIKNTTTVYKQQKIHFIDQNTKRKKGE